MKAQMLKKIKYKMRSFRKVPTVAKAEEMGLRWVVNIHGDNINRLNCRSLWVDEYDHVYACSELHVNKKVLETAEC